MENGETDYKKLYEEALLTISEKEENLLRKEEIISDQQFELDKLRRHLFGFKSEKRTTNVGDGQLGLFELGTTRSVQEELSGSIPVAEKPAPKKRAKGTGRMGLPEELRREDVVIQPSESTEGCVIIGEEVTEVLDVAVLVLLSVLYCLMIVYPCGCFNLSSIALQTKTTIRISAYLIKGQLKPSDADLKLTQKLKEGGKFLEIPVLDHIIVTSEGYYAFADEGGL
jgi:hypothetical protein